MVTLDGFKIVGKSYKRSKFRRKLAESLHIKEKRSLNTQETSVPLKIVFYIAMVSDLFRVGI